MARSGRSRLRDPGAMIASGVQLEVFSMHDTRRPLVEVDLFVEPPIAFEELVARAEWIAIGDRRVRVASIADLIAMKRAAGRPKDVEDIAALEAIASRRKP